MNAKTVSGSAIILTLAFVLAAEYKNAPGRPSDFRDAVGSEGAVEQLQNAAPGDQDLNQPAIPSPQAAEPAAAESAGSAAAAAQSAAGDQSVKRVFSENDPWHKRLAEALGVNYPCYVETRSLGGTQLAEKLTFDDGSRKETVAVKHFTGYSPVGQWPAKILTLLTVNYESNAQKLFDADLAMIEKFRKAGLKTLETVLTDPENKIVVTKFSKGASLAEIFQAALQGDAGAMRLVEKLGAALGTAHRNDLFVGDLNTSNALFVDGEPYFVDLDQASVGGKKGFDIVLPFYYGILQKQIPGEPGAWGLVARTFLQGYLAGGGGAGNIKDALDHKYTAYLAPVVLIRGRASIHAVRREIRKAAGEGPSEESDEAPGLAP